MICITQITAITPISWTGEKLASAMARIIIKAPEPKRDPISNLGVAESKYDFKN
ncbi:hypothetical protein [Hyella patelloides]|uniref:hypothetical protein n=1 Tax=Hyella patelloides TaxID=1982969 RepID=UPI001643D34E|nr:hypothetical protein [Hyella patelloides]